MEKRFIVVAYLSYFRNPDCVRGRTFTFNSLFIPVKGVNDQPAEITLEEARRFLTSIREHPSKQAGGIIAKGDLTQFLFGENEITFNGLKQLGKELVKQLPPFCDSKEDPRKECKKGTRRRNEQISSILHNQLSASATCTAMLVTTGKGYAARGKISDDMLSKFYISMPPENWVSSCLERKCNDNGTERSRSYFGYLNGCSAAGCVLAVADGRNEKFPQHSILWHFGWYAHLATALASALQLVQGFHHELDKRPKDSGMFLALTEEFTTDFDESYGLDLRANQYKQQHQKALRIAGLKRDRLELNRELSKFSESQNTRITHRLTWGLSG